MKAIPTAETCIRGDHSRSLPSSDGEPKAMALSGIGAFGPGALWGEGTMQVITLPVGLRSKREGWLVGEWVHYSVVLPPGCEEDGRRLLEWLGSLGFVEDDWCGMNRSDGGHVDWGPMEPPGDPLPWV